MAWLDDRLNFTLRRGREWITGTKPVMQELKDKATMALADMLAAQDAQKGKTPVVRLPNGDYIWGNPYQAANEEWVKNKMAQQQAAVKQQQEAELYARGMLGAVGGFGGLIAKKSNW